MKVFRVVFGVIFAVVFANVSEDDFAAVFGGMSLGGSWMSLENALQVRVGVSFGLSGMMGMTSYFVFSSSFFGGVAAVLGDVFAKVFRGCLQRRVFAAFSKKKKRGKKRGVPTKNELIPANKGTHRY